MTLFVRTCVLVIVLAGSCLAQIIPIVRITVTNAASPAAGISPGSLIAIRSTVVLPELSRIQLVFVPIGTGQPITAGSLRISSPFVAWAVVPAQVPEGIVQVRLMRDGEVYLSALIQVTAAAPGLFTVSDQGYGPVLAHVYGAGEPRLNSLTNPAVPGQDVTLWFTGMGSRAPQDVSVEIAGSPVQVTYVGHHSSEGLDQVNIRIAQDSFLGCYVPVVIRVGTAESTAGALSINSNPGSCAHPLGLTYSELVTLDSGRTIMIGDIAVGASLQPGSPRLWAAVATAEFSQRDALEVFRLAQPQMPFPQYLSCSAFTGLAGGISLILGADAGPQLSIDGPQGKRLNLEGMQGFYSSRPPDAPEPFFGEGQWNISAPGGTDIAAFDHTFMLPPPLRWTNRDDLAVIPRDRDVVVRWNPEGYGTGDVVTVLLARPPGGVVCRGYAWRGELSLPATLLQQVQPIASGASLTVTVSPHPAARPIFRTTLRDGTTAPVVVTYGSTDLRDVAIQ